MKTYNDASDQLDKGEFKGVPTIGRNTLWNHCRSLVMENIFSKFKLYICALKAGLVRILSSTIDNATFQSFAGFLNLLASSITPHTCNTSFNPEVLAKVMNVAPRNVDIVGDKMCGFLANIVKRYKGSQDLTFNWTLRLMLIIKKKQFEFYLT